MILTAKANVKSVMVFNKNLLPVYTLVVVAVEFLTRLRHNCARV